MIAKIKTSILLIKTYGLKGFITKLKNKLFIKPMKGFKEIGLFFYNKTGLEIGGPSSFFKEYMPIYDKVKNLDGVNFATSTVWTGAIDENKLIPMYLDFYTTGEYGYFGIKSLILIILLISCYFFLN